MESKNTLALSVIIALLAGGIIGYSMPEKQGDYSMSCMEKCMGGEHGKMGMMGMMGGHGAGNGSMDHDSMSGSMDSMVAHLSGKTGAALEEAFLDDMIVHHEGAVAMAKILREGTNRPELLQMADDIITVQTKEIETMKAWKAAWF